jgi:hypothetical protein
MKSSFKINSVVPAHFVNPNAGILDQSLRLDIEATVEYTEAEYMSVLSFSEKFINRFLAIAENRYGVKPVVSVESTDPVSPAEGRLIVYPADINSEMEWFDCSIEATRCLMMDRDYSKSYYPATLKAVAAMSLDDVHPVIRKFAKNLENHLQELLEDSGSILTELDERYKVLRHASRIWAKKYDDALPCDCDLFIEALQEVTSEEEYLAGGNK